MTESGADNYHIPVLLAECLEQLQPASGNVLLDATLGGGGHSAALAQRIQPHGTLIGLDRDPDALIAAGARLDALHLDCSIILLLTPFGKLEEALQADLRTANLRFEGVLFDLGVSSHQLDTARGFSFRRDEPLDMRMSPHAGESAADLLLRETERGLERILREYGEERWARKIAQALVARRTSLEPITTTAQLAAAVERAVPRGAWPRDIHVATRTFQALRIAVNDELGQLEAGLSAAIARLAPGGRIAVISYHSLEDRIVKHAFMAAAGQTPSAPGSSPAAFLPPARAPSVKLITRKPILPTDAEITRNPRARSAKLRVAERLSTEVI
jgi:16S rRNA (cytosine1402-N4)-methyltransferase